MLDSRDLRLIVTIAEHGSLVRAGRVLGVSQSALTRSLATIEEELGAPLFERSHRGMQPTNIGRAILLEGREVVQRMEAVEKTILALRRVRFGSLTVSSSTVALDVVLAPAVAAIIADFPETQIELLPSDHVQAARRVQDGEALLGVTELSELEEPALFDITPLRRHALLRWVRPGHPLLALGRPCVAEEILAYPTVMGPVQAGRVTTHFAAMSPRGPQPHSMLAAFTPAVQTNVGIAARSDAGVLATHASARVHHKAGLLVPLPTNIAWPVTNFGVLVRKDRRLTPAAEALVEAIRQADDEAWAAARPVLEAQGITPPEGYALVGARHAPAILAPVQKRANA
jgi:DNA-binding transcriptional LysR family regulator